MNTLRISKTAALLYLVLSGLLLQNAATGQDQRLELQDGDRVVFLGSEFIEQQIKYNFLETELTLRWPDRQISFINLGWAGDNPSAIAPRLFRRVLKKDFGVSLKNSIESNPPTSSFVTAPTLSPHLFRSTLRSYLTN